MVFCSFVGVWFFFFGGSGYVFAEASGVATKSLPNEVSGGAARFSVSSSGCRGISGAHTRKKVVALTFDDGPNKKYTEEILEVLWLNEIKATFFVVGRNVDDHPGIAMAVFRDGHVIANHGYSHHHLNRLSGEAIETELTKTNTSIHKVIGVYPALFRPPYGACSLKSARVAKNLGLTTIMWSAMTDDYHNDSTTPEKIASAIIKLVRPGTIIGLHDGGGKREKTVVALQIIIDSLIDEGYEFLTVPDLLGVQAYV